MRCGGKAGRLTAFLPSRFDVIARDKRRMFLGQEYWGKPVPGFGDPEARLLIIGLAPAAHGGNRTGRIFTGDRSGDFLFAALHLPSKYLHAGMSLPPATGRQH